MKVLGVIVYINIPKKEIAFERKCNVLLLFVCQDIVTQNVQYCVQLHHYHKAKVESPQTITIMMVKVINI